MKFLSEQLSDKLEILTESATEEGKAPEYYIEGVFLQSEIKNRNNRIYPRAIVAKEVERYKRDMVAKKMSYGELQHPSSLQIDLDRVSHLITELYQDPSDDRLWRGKARLMQNTPCGRIALSILQEGGNLGLSSRAGGSVIREDGVDIVQDDFRLVTAGDIVWIASAQTAESVSLLAESVEWELDDQGIFQVKEIKQQDKSVAQLKAFEKLLYQLKL